MTIVNASEFVKAHFRWIWEAPEDTGERTVAAEAVTALFVLAEGWLDIVALEARLGLYDREIFTEAQARPRDQFQLLRLEPANHVRIKPMYRPTEARTATLDAATAASWVDSKLAEETAPDARYELSLRELLVAGSRARLPDSVSSEPLTVSCYAGEIEVPVDRGWVTAPAHPPGVPNPVSLRIANLDGALRLVLEAFWSPWAGDQAPIPPIRDGLLRLAARGWHADA